MFTSQERAAIRDSLIETACSDKAVRAAALVGSGATGQEDAFSDIDLALRIAPGTDPETVAARWTAMMYADHDTVHHLDMIAGGILYRVFLLGSSLQVDLSFWPDDQFRATEPSFKVIFGEANAPTSAPSPDAERLAGMGWLYALHARSAIARGRCWQAVLMLDGIRDQIIALACLRHRLNPHHGRGVDKLPPDVLSNLESTRAQTLDPRELLRANKTTIYALLTEIEQHDSQLARRLSIPAQDLAHPAGKV